MNIQFLYLLILCASCNLVIPNQEATEHTVELIDNSIAYHSFTPQLAEPELGSDYEIEHAYQLDSLTVVTAYSEGDLETSEKPINWGDRLLVLQDKKIIYESVPVGDVYLYEPHFYKNTLNQAVIIVCQLGYEYYFGGEVFKLENGRIESIGMLDIESSDPEISLTEILRIKEEEDALIFSFDTDSLNYKPGTETRLIENQDIHYIYKDHALTLIGV